MIARIFIASLVLAAGIAQAECDRPWPVLIPEEIPDRDGLLALQGEVKDYLAKANAYLECNDAEQRAIPFDEADPESVAEADRQLEIMVRRYNNTVDEMHVVGERFNALVRAYKAREDGEEEGDG